MWDNDNMTVTVNIQLFNNAFPDNHNRIGKYSDLNAQNDYFDNLTKLEIDGLYNKIGEPLIIKGDYVDFCGYNYGRFQYHNIWFYFSIVDFIVINETKVSLIYSLDYYETGRYQYNVSIGKGTINNITHGSSVLKISPIPYTENGLGKLNHSSLDSYIITGIAVYVFVGYNSTQNGIYVYKVSSHSATDLLNFYNTVLDGRIFNEFIRNGVIANAMSDIKGAWLLPDIITDNIIISNKNWNIIEYTQVYKHNHLSVDLNDFSYNKNITLKRTDSEHSVFLDNNLNKIWEFPTGYYYNDSVNCRFIMDISATSGIMKIYISSLKESIVLPLLSVNVFNDTYLEYSARQRQADINLRHLNNEQQMINGLLNMGGSIAGGAVSGGMATKNPMGIVAGAGAGLTSGLVGSIGGFYLNEYYGNKQQEITDIGYKKQANNLLLYGDGLISSGFNFSCGFVNESYLGDLGTDRVNKIIETYGYEINQHYPNVQNYIDELMTVLNENPYIRGNFEINGNIPDNWKFQIKERFNGGVTFGL